MSAGTTRMGPVGRIEIDLAKRPDCSLIGFSEDVGQLITVIPMTLPPPAIGLKRLLHLVLPTGGVISGMAIVKHHRAESGGTVTGCGMAFAAIGAPQRAALEIFVRASTAPSRASLPPPPRSADDPRRTHNRIPAQIDVQIERPRVSLPPSDLELVDDEEDPRALEADVTFDGENNFYNGFSENVGDGGLFLQSWAAHAVGDRVALRVTLPDSDVPLEIVGEVRWMRAYNAADDTPPGIGVAFVGLAPAAQKRIEDFVEQRRPLFYD